MEEIGSLGAGLNGRVHLRKACQVCTPWIMQGILGLPRNKSRTGGSVGRVSSRHIFRSDVGIVVRLEEGRIRQAGSWFIYGRTVIAC